MTASRSHYDILNVSQDAEPVVIEAAYRALMKRYHPDQSPTHGEGVPSAVRINEAFSVLRDPERRAEYDHREWVRSQNIQLAQYLPPPSARRPNFFGWGGWLVALILAGAIALIAGRSGGVPSVPNGEEADAGRSAAPVLHSQPRLPDEGAVTPAQEAEITAEAWRQPARPPARPEPEKVADPPAQPPPAAHRNWALRGHARPIWRRRPVHANPPTGRDFVERHGGIY